MVHDLSNNYCGKKRKKEEMIMKRKKKLNRKVYMKPSFNWRSLDLEILGMAKKSVKVDIYGNYLQEGRI